MATDYTYLYEEYPEVISADQLYRICHTYEHQDLISVQRCR